MHEAYFRKFRNRSTRRSAASPNPWATDDSRRAVALDGFLGTFLLWLSAPAHLSAGARTSAIQLVSSHKEEPFGSAVLERPFGSGDSSAQAMRRFMGRPRLTELLSHPVPIRPNTMEY